MPHACVAQQGAESSPATTPAEPPPAAANLAASPPDAPVEVQFTLPRAHHPWARFQPNSWRGIRTTTETFDAEGKVASHSVTTQVEVLKAVAKDSYTLDVQVTVDLVGKRIVGEWRTRVLGLLTDSSARVIATRVLQPVELRLADRKISCNVLDQQVRDEQHVLHQRLYYAAQQSPYILQREVSELPDQPTEMPRWTQTDRIISLKIPYSVGEKIFSCSCLKTVRTSNKGGTVRMALQTDAVPGGVVAAWSTDTDAEGKPARWSLLELIDFGVAPLDSQPPSRRRRRTGRNRLPQVVQ